MMQTDYALTVKPHVSWICDGNFTGRMATHDPEVPQSWRSNKKRLERRLQPLEVS